MMWNNAGCFLAPRQHKIAAVVSAAISNPDSADDSHSSSLEAEDIDFTVTEPVKTPCALSIVRRDPFWGVEQASFFVERNLHPEINLQAHLQAPRFVHKVNVASY